jgi:hypothetical protein
MICFFKINKINIGQDGKGFHPNWHLESVQIQKETENYKYTNLFIFFKFIFFFTFSFLAKKILDQSTSFIDLTPTQARIKFFFSSSFFSHLLLIL